MLMVPGRLCTRLASSYGHDRLKTLSSGLLGPKMNGRRGHWTRGSLSVAVALRLSAAPPLPTQRAHLDPSLMHEKESDTDHATTSSPLKDSDDNRMDGEPRAGAEEGKNQSGETDTGAARGDVAAMEKQQSSPKDNDGDVVMANGGGSDDNEEEEDNDEEEEEEKSVKQEEPKQQQPQQPPSTNGEHRNGEEKKSDDKPKADMTGSAPPPPVMKGTLSYDIDQRRHLIRGMWNYENSTVFPPQRFELLRNLSPSEDLKKLPQDGEFHGSFSLAYFHTTSKGKQKERSKVIPESGVKIKFTPDSDGDGYKVDGTGTNQFGIFHINGTAKPSPDPADPTLNIVLRKRYEPSATAAEPVPEPVKTNSGKLITAAVEEEGGPLPPPSKSFPSGVVCLRGKLYKEESTELGLNEVIHRINGMWASGLDFLLSDPGNTRGLANRFEYEHKSSVPSHQFPVSGRYSGWFDLSNDDGSRTRINERDVTLKFRSNNAGYHNVEGKGSNVFGKYSITGTLTADNVLTIFRHFQPRKLKTKSITLSTAAPPAAPRASLTQPGFEPKLKLEDVKVPDGNGQVLEPLTSPEHSLYSAVSRGILRLNDDGSHSCQGKWAVTREHFTSGMTSNFNFRLEAHFTTEALTAMKAAGAKDTAGQPRQFPVDSAMYKGSFQLKKQGSRYQTIVDQQVVMKFRPNTLGSYNVYGKGVNAIGEFNLIGTMVMSGKTGGQVELYRVYPPDKMAAPVVPKTTAPAPVVPKLTREGSVPSLPSAPPSGPLQRRESTRLVKLPSKLEDDDPSALLTRTMNKCSQILRLIREKDVELGAFFSEPVDPVVLGIPTYHQIIKEPMDLRTVHRRMEAGSIEDPEEFARLVRLVFENAMTFNIDPAHSVHQAARTLLVLFNQKFRDVERMMQNIKRAQDGDKKGDKKRKRLGEELKSPKRRRLEEAQAMAAANASAVAAIVAAAPPTSSTTVTRSEFNMLLNLIQQLQKQIVQTHTAVAELSPGDDNDAMSVTSVPMSVKSSSLAALPPAPAPAPERKKPVKRKSEQAMSEPPVSVDDSRPLTLDEQELLTETINELPPEHLGGIIQIIREAAPVGADEDEIDLEIDQLDTKTQRKLLRHVSKFVKKSKAKVAKKKPKAKKSEDSSPATKKSKAAPKPQPKAATESFFAFGGKGDSDSDDSDDDDDGDAKGTTTTSQPPGGKTFSADAAKDFSLGSGLGDLNNDDDDDLGNDGLAANWNLAKPDDDKSDKEDDEDDAWGAARELAAAAKAREAERKAREEKMKAEAEALKEQRLADAAARSEEIRAQKLEEEANEARLKEQQEKDAEEARKAAREAARAQVQSVEQTVDLDAQRDIMKQYEQSFLDKDLGSASPSSDFGF